MSNQTPERVDRIMVFGTFDGLHPGHVNFFKQARALCKNPLLIVSVARDQNVRKIKGQDPELNEKKRFSLVARCKLVDKAVFGGLKDHLPHIKKENPRIIALGYDQRAYVKNLRKELAKKGLRVKIIRLKPYKEKIYKNRLIKKRRGSGYKGRRTTSVER